MVASTDNFNLSLSQKIASAGLAGCTADLVTFPLDTVKVWLQVRGESLAPSSRKSNLQSSKWQKKTNLTGKPSFPAKPSSNLSLFDKFRFKPKSLVRAESGAAAILSRPNPGLVGTIMQGVRANGFFSLYGGIAAGLQRQVAFCAVRIGLYDNVKAFYQHLLPGSSDGKQIGQRILAGTTTAFIAVALFQPTEVVKIRMQAQTSKSAEGRIYSSSLQAYRTLFKIGISEAWKGLGANAARLGVVNVCELVTYDVVKEMILDHKIMSDNPACHFTSAFLSGFITTVVASPIDVVKTRYMNSRASQYSGPIGCAKNMLFTEGVRAFYKGFVPAYLRLGSWNIVMFVSYEQYKRAFHQWNAQQI